MWVARDKDDKLWMFINKPIKKDNEWMSTDDDFSSFALVDIDFKPFRNIKWSDNEPTMVDLIIRGKKY